MSGLEGDFLARVQGGLTTIAQAWAVTRTDGQVLGFTDHDRGLTFEGIIFAPDSGLSAKALSQSTGLSVDNVEAVGLLSSDAITERDIETGLYDGAEVRSWRVNWADVTMRWLFFRGTLGEIRRAEGTFHAELRGLTEALNRPLGRAFQKPCTAVLGDRACGFALETLGFQAELEVEVVQEALRFTWGALDGFADGWFLGGRLDVLTGDAVGSWGVVKLDERRDGSRVIELWQPIGGRVVAPGDRVRLTAGCDKRMATCRSKFQNLVNFQGFPDIPGEDWIVAYPTSSDPNTGGSRR